MRFLAALILASSLSVFPATAQLDSASLRAKFGAPLSRETFHVPAGFDLVVDYGPDHQLCRIEVPPMMPSDEAVTNADLMRQRMQAFLRELVPDSTRGKELFRAMQSTGAVSVLIADYEHLSISEVRDGNYPFGKEPIRVLFKKPGCGSERAK